MLSYIVGILAVLLLLANPISELLYPHQSRLRVSPRPQLNESLLAIDAPDATVPECPPDAYGARILSREPLVVYLEGFLSVEERRHLLDISDPLFEPSTITNNGNSTLRDTTVRDSHVALIPRTDTVRCIEARARAFQGFRSDLWIERLRTQRYTPGGHYSHHFDWGSNVVGWGRVSSMMAWVDGEEVVGGGTEFPFLQKVEEEGGRSWCEFVECEDVKAKSKDESDSEGGGEQPEKGAEQGGVTFKVVPGNAVYWENFAADGRGYEETWHAGLPVEEGFKVGLNIWSFGRIR
ncbi:Fc.00g076720.m01.CDS01 [Cosmosporella sp. VM-42]